MPKRSVGEEVLSLVTGGHPKSRWVLGAIFASSFIVGIVAPYFGLRPYRRLLVYGIAGVWLLVITLAIALGERTDE